MAHTQRTIPRQLRPIPKYHLRVTTLRRIRHVSGKRHTMNVAPLFQLFNKILIRDSRIAGPVPNLHLRPWPGITGVVATNYVTPLLRSLDVATEAAEIVWVRRRTAWDGHASGCCAGVDGGGSKDIGVDG